MNGRFRIDRVISEDPIIIRLAYLRLQSFGELGAFKVSNVSIPKGRKVIKRRIKSQRSQAKELDLLINTSDPHVPFILELTSKP